MKKSEAPAAAKPEKSEKKEIIPDPRFLLVRYSLTALTSRLQKNRP